MDGVGDRCVCITCKFGKNQVFVSFAAVGCCHSKESKRIFFLSFKQCESIKCESKK